MAQSPGAQSVGRPKAKLLPADTPPPANLEAEQAVLGGIMLAVRDGEADAVRETLAALHAADFYSEQHRHIFKAMEAVQMSGRLPDLLTVTDTLAQTQTLDAAGGAAYVTDLLNATFGPSTLPQHLRIVKRDSAKRTLLTAGLALVDGAQNGQPPEDLAQEMSRIIQGIDSTLSREGSLKNRIQTAEDLLTGADAEQVWWPLWGQTGFTGPGLGTLLSGHAKVAGKSTSVSIGIRDRLLAEPGFKALVLSEEPRSLWIRRLRTWHFPPGLLLRFADGTPWPTLLREIERADVQLIVVDTLRAFAGIVDENDASKVTEAVQPLIFLARRKQAGIIATHHLRKSEGDEGLAHSGSTALTALFDIMITMRLTKDHAPNRRNLEAYSRFDETPRALTIELRGAEIVPLGAPEAVTLNEVAARVQSILRVDEGLTVVAIREALDDPVPSPEQVSRALKTLLPEKVVRTGKGIRGDPYLWWGKRFYSSTNLS